MTTPPGSGRWRTLWRSLAALGLSLLAFAAAAQSDGEPSVAADSPISVVPEAEREALRRDAPRLALDARIGGRTAREVARDVLALARAGLARRANLDEKGRDETRFLDPLDRIVAEGTEAERLIEAFRTRWAGGVDPAFEACAY